VDDKDVREMREGTRNVEERDQAPENVQAAHEVKEEPANEFVS
jgi:uridine kinase